MHGVPRFFASLRMAVGTCRMCLLSLLLNLPPTPSLRGKGANSAPRVGERLGEWF